MRGPVELEENQFATSGCILKRALRRVPATPLDPGGSALIVSLA